MAWTVERTGDLKVLKEVLKGALEGKTGKIEEGTDLGEKIKGLDLDTLSLGLLLDSQQRREEGIGCKDLEFRRLLRAGVTNLRVFNAEMALNIQKLRELI